MALADVKIIKSNGGLGRRNPSSDGVSGFLTTGVAVPGKLVLGTVYKLQNMQDVQAIGIDEAYDTANNVLLFYSLAEIFRVNPDITLYLMVAPQATTMADLLDPTKQYGPKLIAESEYSIVQLAVSFNPGGDYVPAPSGGLDGQVIAAVAQAQLLATYSEGLHAPISSIGLEGKGFNGTTTAATDLRTLASNKVSVIIGQDASSAAAVSHPNHAAIGTWLGCVSKAVVNVNIGWPEQFPLTDGLKAKWLKAGLSGGTSISSYTGQQLNQLDDKGYIFARVIPQFAGVYLNDSHTCTELADDYSRIEMNRTIDKAIKNIRAALAAKLLSPLMVDEQTGLLDPATVAVFETLAQSEVDAMKRASEISGGTVYINPEQNILANQTLEVDVEIVPTGLAHTIKVKIGFNNPYKQ